MLEALQDVVATRYTVRGIELDATGSLSPGWFSRILELTRWQVFSMDEFSHRYRLEGGVARAGTFEYGVPLTYQDDLEILTWVARVGRTSFDFAHRVTRLRDGAVAARARMAVVNLGPEGPTPLEPSLREVIVDQPAPAVRPWPEGERAQAWTREWTVRPSDQDSFRHVNQARYVDYIDDTRWFAAQAGAAAGMDGPLSALTVEYLRETHAGEKVRMETWVTGPRSRAFELTRGPEREVLTRGQAFGRNP